MYRLSLSRWRDRKKDGWTNIWMMDELGGW